MFFFPTIHPPLTFPGHRTDTTSTTSLGSTSTTHTFSTVTNGTSTNTIEPDGIFNGKIIAVGIAAPVSVIIVVMLAILIYKRRVRITSFWVDLRRVLVLHCCDNEEERDLELQNRRADEERMILNERRQKKDGRKPTVDSNTQTEQQEDDKEDKKDEWRCPQVSWQEWIDSW
ncbi:Oidioi.mRNA.OKI2018_I69.PAR.g9455.t1.cds [Oikopleura dioica]|uniref:Oidioi.mRNA.OKI2018_I69.PAR.g9455.t1.cds n=1 Tax=Oikopleura dioica TaxID=34765 RepID=A0ABN7RPV4_OIKDI|nr:Oidioi.mRNA.OKI2018_I69.PAR.g9455.t1.cds [Oikopleura dioica]